MKKASKLTPPARSRSYGMVVDYLVRFGVGRVVDRADTQYPSIRGGLIGFAGTLTQGEARPGDLVRIESAGRSKWTLSWLRETRVRPHGDYEYLCESLLDGELCWWSNVGISYLHRLTLENHPEWRWTDQQHAFDDKWGKACDRHDPYLYRPVMPLFNDDGSATVGTRTRHSMDNHRPTRRIENWRKATIRALSATYLELVADHEAYTAQRASA